MVVWNINVINGCLVRSFVNNDNVGLVVGDSMISLNRKTPQDLGGFIFFYCSQLVVVPANFVVDDASIQQEKRVYVFTVVIVSF